MRYRKKPAASTMQGSISSLASALLAWLIFASPGCKQAEVEQADFAQEIELGIRESKSPDEPLASTAVAGEQPWVSEELLPIDDWDIQYLGGKRVGYSHVRISRGNIFGIEISRIAEFQIQSGGKEVRYEVSLESLEYLDGSMAKFVERTVMGDSTSETTGQLKNDQLRLTTTNSDATSVLSTVPWQPGTWGVLGVQSILLQKPMQPDERRLAKAFLPGMNKIVSVELTAGQPEITSVASGLTPELLPIDVVMRSGDTGMRSKAWTDSKGNILKTATLDDSMATSFRVEPEVGQRIADEFRLHRLLGNAAVYVGEVPKANASSVTYRVEGLGVDLFGLWSNHGRQAVKSLNALTAELTVTNAPNPDSAEADAPADECLQPSSLIQSNHKAIESLAMNLMDDSTKPQDIVLALTKGLNRNMRAVAPNATIAGALEAARRLEGDSTEYAMLLVALLRNRSIPARVAMGIKIDPASEQLRFHMWTEAWVEQRWLSLDATTGGVAGLDCLKVTESAMSNENPYPQILSLLEKIQALTIQLAGQE